MVVRQRPVGTVTRGTTNPNRLRRVDRWLASVEAWRLAVDPPATVVDLGYGASGVTVRELSDRLRAVRSDVEVVGLEIDPGRVVAAGPLTRPGLRFGVGGFEIPLPGGARPSVVRAFNVLRQYDESEVPAAWHRVVGRLAPHGLFVDGTCDKLGRRSTWVAITGGGPRSLTMSMSLAAVDRPSDVAERLPKALIHRNVPGEPVHAYLQALDRAWARQAPLASYGRRQRFVATVEELRRDGWPIAHAPRRWRLGEVSVSWWAVAPSRRA